MGTPDSQSEQHQPSGFGQRTALDSSQDCSSMQDNIGEPSSLPLRGQLKRKRKVRSIQKRYSILDVHAATTQAIRRRLHVIFNEKAETSLQHLNHCFDVVERADARPKTLMEMWREMKDSNQSLDEVCDATSTYGKVHIKSAKSQKWIGDCLTGFASYYERTYLSGRKDDNTPSRWPRAVYRTVKLVSQLSEMIGSASLIILLSLALNDSRLTFIARARDKDMTDILNHLGPEVLNLLKECATATRDQSAVVSEKTIIPLLNPVAFVAWCYESVCKELDLQGFSKLSNEIFAKISLEDAKSAIVATHVPPPQSNATTAVQAPEGSTNHIDRSRAHSPAMPRGGKVPPRSSSPAKTSRGDVNPGTTPSSPGSSQTSEQPPENARSPSDRSPTMPNRYGREQTFSTSSELGTDTTQRDGQFPSISLEQEGDTSTNHVNGRASGTHSGNGPDHPNTSPIASNSLLLLSSPNSRLLPDEESHSTVWSQSTKEVDSAGAADSAVTSAGSAQTSGNYSPYGFYMLAPLMIEQLLLFHFNILRDYGPKVKFHFGYLSSCD
ncbi:hypothetical protein PCL_08635 [Purpureocillium lilacinum]|uniref:Uncharacterized protein n=1 Tax=Purpureocillium lilacinum TaxID=33203 RepID=A0A2U3DR39_PURLI|nr:hypothetical protein PCL_08635 [Purpureocillium lilacinum]